MVYQGQSTQQLLTIIKQNRHYCVNFVFICAVGKRMLTQ
jgi:hypothetical protein